jgi:hypothetical protein
VEPAEASRDTLEAWCAAAQRSVRRRSASATPSSRANRRIAGDLRAIDRPVIGERFERGEHDPAAVDFEERAQLLARVAAAEPSVPSAGHYGYDPVRNRSVAVDNGALLQALSKSTAPTRWSRRFAPPAVADGLPVRSAT